MKRIDGMLAMVAVLMTVSAHADDASKRAKVVELFGVMHVNQMSEQVTASVRKQMEMSMRGLPGTANMNAEQKRLRDEYENKVMAIVQQNMSWTVLEPQMIELYASSYSETEIDGILAFYKGPVGQKMLEKTPEITEKSMSITSEKLSTLQPKVSALAQEFASRYAAAQDAPAKAGTGSTGSTK